MKVINLPAFIHDSGQTFLSSVWPYYRLKLTSACLRARVANVTAHPLSGFGHSLLKADLYSFHFCVCQIVFWFDSTITQQRCSVAASRFAVKSPGIHCISLINKANDSAVVIHLRMTLFFFPLPLLAGSMTASLCEEEERCLQIIGGMSCCHFYGRFPKGWAPFRLHARWTAITFTELIHTNQKRNFVMTSVCYIIMNVTVIYSDKLATQFKTKTAWHWERLILISSQVHTYR